MLGIYVHIPFCEAKCGYCDFHSLVADSDIMERYLDALKLEIDYYSRKIGEQECTTLYIGGGTPTFLSSEQLDFILQHLVNSFNLRPGFEFTVEANPGTLTHSKLAVLAEAGVNRISLGAQVFDDHILELIGRTHTVADIVANMDLACQLGITNISLDLIHGLPHQNLANWQTTLQAAIDLKPTHLSCYSLILEPGTPFYYQHEAGNLSLASEEEEADMFEFTQEFLPKNGFLQYEVSNYALPAMQSQHNLIYWHNQSYLGLGSGAHGYYNSIRYSNSLNLNQYINSWLQHQPALDYKELITRETAIEEQMMLGLRLIAGIDLNQFMQRFGESVEAVYGQEIDNLICRGLLVKDENSLRLTKQGLALGNIVFSAFLR